jgi:broad specificity phosphatase PhoE
MAQYIYLVRHSRPELPGNGPYCIGGKTDLPLSESGKKQANNLIHCFDFVTTIYSGRLRRSRETAEILAQGRLPITICPAFDEIDVGKWENLSFADIRREYPEVYEQRGADWSIPPVGGETLEHAADRMQKGILELLKKDTGDIVIVSHEGSIRALVWRLMHLDTKMDAMFRQPYGSITVLKYEYGALSVTAAGKLPDDVPTDEEIVEMWDVCGTPLKIRDHSRAVCEECRYFFELLRDAGHISPWGILRAAALLHDACRVAGHAHPGLAASYLRERGYLKTAAMIAGHHDPAVVTDPVSGTAILYLADKLIEGKKKVSIEKRFADSAIKCTTEEAKESHQKQFETAVRIRNEIAGIVTGKGDVAL